ncbi:MAG: hypothetical protein LBE35_11380 [Clostridiales bacterium]|jgi:hypothetical protein|nr:hypothetical protein [Clostridiales bacterium]
MAYQYTMAKNTIRRLITSDMMSKDVIAVKQNRHITDSKGYIMGRSYIYGDLNTAQDLVNRYHGTGRIITHGENEIWSRREVITADRDIGVNIDPTTGEETTTNRFTIHYSDVGTHIVPAVREG